MRLGTEPGAERPGQTPTIQGCNRIAVTASTLSDETIVGSVASSRSVLHSISACLLDEFLQETTGLATSHPQRAS